MPGISLAPFIGEERNLTEVYTYQSETAPGRIATVAGYEEQWDGSKVNYIADDFSWEIVSEAASPYVSLATVGGKLQPVLAPGWYQVWARVAMQFAQGANVTYARAWLQGTTGPGFGQFSGDSFVPYRSQASTGGSGVIGNTTPTIVQSDGTRSLSLKVHWTPDVEPTSMPDFTLYVIKLA